MQPGSSSTGDGNPHAGMQDVFTKAQKVKTELPPSLNMLLQSGHEPRPQDITNTHAKTALFVVVGWIILDI